jgi:hypothetical protein
MGQLPPPLMPPPGAPPGMMLPPPGMPPPGFMPPPGTLLNPACEHYSSRCSFVSIGQTHDANIRPITPADFVCSFISVAAWSFVTAKLGFILTGRLSAGDGCSHAGYRSAPRIAAQPAVQAVAVNKEAATISGASTVAKRIPAQQVRRVQCRGVSESTSHNK